MAKRPKTDRCATLIAMRDDIKDWAARWAKVANAERDELQALDDDTRQRQTSAMFASALARDWATTSPREVEQVRERWMRLKKLVRVR